MNCALWLKRTAMIYGGNPALYRGEKCIASYREFDDHAATIGANLARKYNIKPGDRVAIFAKNMIEYLEVMYGIWYAGAVVVPINAKLHPLEASWIIENAEADCIFMTTELVANTKNHLPTCCKHVIDITGEDYTNLKIGEGNSSPITREKDDMAWLFYTSGTTGKPKGVMITHGNILAMAFSYLVDVDDVFMEDAALYAAPISHGAGFYNIQHIVRASRHIVPESAGFQPQEIFALAKKMKNIHMFAAPTMVKRLVDTAKELGESGEGIRTIVYGGGPMYLADIEEAVHVFGSRFCQIYGQGESPMAISALPRSMVSDRTHPRWRERLASTGVAQSCVEVRVVNDEGQDCSIDETGEVIVKGTTVMASYWRNEKANAETLKDGWLWTGDMGALDVDGFLTLKDRSKDMIISGGSNIYPREVEEALLTHEDVQEVSVIGTPDTEWGEVVIAFVVPTKEDFNDEKILDNHCLDSIARFKRPKSYHFVSELPKNNYGKVLKTELRKRMNDSQEEK